MLDEVKIFDPKEFDLSIHTNPGISYSRETY
jgi:hypothetical protein